MIERLRRRAILIAFTAVVAPACAQSQAPAGGPVTFQQVADALAPPPDHTISYGPETSQFGELRLPARRGPHPVAILIHGGCWSSAYDLKHLGAIAEDLKNAGIATWAVEYRRVGEAGGGWPGTFHDVALGADHLRTLADSFDLDLTRIVAVGHSAGGQLALWLAGRDNLQETSEFWHPTPLRLTGVVGLAAITDLEEFARSPGGCNAGAAQVVGGSPMERTGRYRQVSPAALLRLWIPIRLFHGAADPIVPTSQSTEFAAAAFELGEDATVELMPGAGHFDLVAPFTPSWERISASILELLSAQ